MEFKCSDCGHVTVIHVYTLGQKVKCEKCKSINTKFVAPEGDYDNVNIGEFSSKNSEGKKKILKERSHNHFKKFDEEKKMDMIKNQFKPKKK